MNGENQNLKNWDKIKENRLIFMFHKAKMLQVVKFFQNHISEFSTVENWIIME